MALSELRNRNGADTEKPLVPEREKSATIISTDLEGPHLLGDTALNVMSLYVHPNSNSHGIDYGATLYGATYDWFEEKFDRNGLGQEGSDIILAMPALLYFGVTADMIRKEAETSRRTPGSAEYVKYLKSQGAVVLGVTTAWEDAHRDIVINKVGLDGIVGTEFPIDDARKQLQSSGKWEEEMDATRKFLQGSFAIIGQMSNSQNGQKEELEGQLKDRIGQFYYETLGISWDLEGKQIVRSGKSTEIARIMVGYDVVGDKRKAEVARQLFLTHSKPRAVNLAIGDGFNDRRMLGESPWSIGLNGVDAAKAAKIGIIASDVGMPLIEVTERILRNPVCLESNIQEIIREAQKVLGDKAIIHRGGRDISSELIASHKAMKKEIRGKGALLP